MDSVIWRRRCLRCKGVSAHFGWAVVRFEDRLAALHFLRPISGRRSRRRHPSVSPMSQWIFSCRVHHRRLRRHGCDCEQVNLQALRLASARTRGVRWLAQAQTLAENEIVLLSCTQAAVACCISLTGAQGSMQLRSGVACSVCLVTTSQNINVDASSWRHKSILRACTRSSTGCCAPNRS